MSQTKSGEEINKVSIEGKLEKNSDNIEGYEYVSDLSTDGARIMDEGLGRTITIRTFDFNMNPTLKELPSQQEIFNHHSKQVSTLLWADGLVPVEQFPPRVIIDKKRRTYKIFVVCAPRMSQMFAEKPMNLSEELSKENARNTRH